MYSLLAPLSPLAPHLPVVSVYSLTGTVSPLPRLFSRKKARRGDASARWFAERKIVKRFMKPFMKLFTSAIWANQGFCDTRVCVLFFVYTCAMHRRAYYANCILHDFMSAIIFKRFVPGFINKDCFINFTNSKYFQYNFSFKRTSFLRANELWF